jgi:IS30 family transposase
MTMTIVEAARGMTGGVDTHLDVHVAAALDPLGGLLGTESFSTDPAGYKALVPGRGELRRELARCLRSSRAQRKPRVPGERRGRMGDMVMISERPGEVADRAVPGHWEGDLVIGKMGRSQVGTLVERSTGYLVLVHLPGSRDAPVVAEAMRKTVRRLPRELMRSITWDQGREMAAHGTFTVATGVQVYFCDPHSPW